jgi:CBS domain-containing protein
MLTAGRIVATKHDRTIYVTAPEASLFDAATLMLDANVGALVVMKGGEVVGMLGERDFLRHAHTIANAPRPLRVADVMNTDVQTVSADLSGGECMTLMTRLRQRHLPVWNGSTLAGVISIGDLVRHVIDEQRFAIEQLEHYIVS